VPVVECLCQDEEDPTNYKFFRYMCVKNLNKMYILLDSKNYHFTDSERANYRQCTDQFLVCYTKCAKIKEGAGKKMWNIVPKFHYCGHMPEQADYLNPRLVTTYAGETMVGFMVSLGHSCLNGTPAWLVSHSMCWKIRLAMYLRLYHGLEDEV